METNTSDFICKVGDRDLLLGAFRPQVIALILDDLELLLDLSEAHFRRRLTKSGSL